MADTGTPAGSIVVGIDGSSSSDRALAWAVVQAGAEHRPLTLVHSVRPVDLSHVSWMDAAGTDQGRVDEDLRREGQGLLTSAVTHAHHLDVDLDVHQVLDRSDPRVALLAQSQSAGMVVVGSRGRGPVASLLLGSVSVALSKHAECPVVVIRPSETEVDGQGVAVAVYGTSADRPAVEFAYRIAALRSLPVTAVHCFWDSAHLDPSEREVAADEVGLDDLRLLLNDAVEDVRATFPDVQDRLLLMRGFSDQALIRLSRTMDLVVVGSQHTSVLQEIVYGSLAPTVIEHAHCPVAVVATAADE